MLVLWQQIGQARPEPGWSGSLRLVWLPSLRCQQFIEPVEAIRRFRRALVQAQPAYREPYSDSRCLVPSVIAGWVLPLG